MMSFHDGRSSERRFLSPVHFDTSDTGATMVRHTGFIPDGPEGFRGGNYIVSVIVEVSYTGSVDKELTEATIRRYAEAVVRTVDGDVTLGAAATGVVDAIFIGATVATVGDESEIRINYSLEFEVKVTTTN